jgi:hypothetical protein
MTIRANRSAYYDAQYYNDSSGKFETSIKKEDFNNLIQALTKADLRNLKSKYEVPWTDDQGSILTVTYNNGTIKTIDDYGMRGTKGLEKIYGLLYNLRTNQKWEKI